MICRHESNELIWNLFLLKVSFFVFVVYRYFVIKISYIFYIFIICHFFSSFGTLIDNEVCFKNFLFNLYFNNRSIIEKNVFVFKKKNLR